MINNVTLVGRLTRDPELKYTQQNTAVANFTLAVNRRFKSASGEREADFINCVIWKTGAENLSNWGKKGMLIGVTGSIQVRSYEDNSGKRIYVTEVLADNFQMFESRQERENAGNRQAVQAPRKPVQSTPTPGPLAGQPLEIADDDLPF